MASSLQLAPRLADRHGERLVLGDAPPRLDGDRLGGSTEFPPPSARSRGRAVRWLARCDSRRRTPGIEPRERGQGDADAEDDDDPAERAQRASHRATASSISRGIAEDGRHLLDACAARETVAPVRGGSTSGRPSIPSGVEPPSAARISSRPPARRRRRRPSRGSAPPPRRPAARPPGSAARRRRTRTPSPRAPPCRARPASGISRRSASESRCSASDSARGA